MAIEVIGLGANGLFINNPIITDVYFNSSGNEALSFFTIQITNASTTQDSGIIKIYPKLNSNTIKIDISPILKSMFRRPKHNTNYTTISDDSNNREVFNFRFIANYTIDGVPFSQILILNNKTFFRGGYRSNSQNHDSAVGSYLSPIDITPYWVGYPVASYQVALDYKIIKNPGIASLQNRESRVQHACNNYYVKFLNSLGGYSYWLFQGLTEAKSTTNLGSSNVFNNFHDFGNTVERNVSLYSKVPARFYPLMEDLADSREIYLYNYSLAQWYPIKNNNNKTDKNENKKIYEVRFSFELASSYNPSAW